MSPEAVLSTTELPDLESTSNFTDVITLATTKAAVDNSGPNTFNVVLISVIVGVAVALIITVVCTCI